MEKTTHETNEIKRFDQIRNLIDLHASETTIISDSAIQAEFMETVCKLNLTELIKKAYNAIPKKLVEDIVNHMKELRREEFALLFLGQSNSYDSRTVIDSILTTANTVFSKEIEKVEQIIKDNFVLKKSDEDFMPTIASNTKEEFYAIINEYLRDLKKSRKSIKNVVENTVQKTTSKL